MNFTRKNDKRTALNKLIAKSSLAILLAGFMLPVTHTAQAQTKPSQAKIRQPDAFRDVVCIRHKRTTFITSYSDDGKEIWCALDNPRDCVANRGRATSLACAYSRSRAAQFVARADNLKSYVESQSAQSAPVASTASATQPNDNDAQAAPTASSTVDEQKLQDELLAVQERLVTLKARQLELRKREISLRQRLAN